MFFRTITVRSDYSQLLMFLGTISFVLVRLLPVGLRGGVVPPRSSNEDCLTASWIFDSRKRVRSVTSVLHLYEIGQTTVLSGYSQLSEFGRVALTDYPQ